MISIVNAIGAEGEDEDSLSKENRNVQLLEPFRVTGTQASTLNKLPLIRVVILTSSQTSVEVSWYE